jgi:diguanylate cyclase (GGDEF)-like protein
LSFKHRLRIFFFLLTVVPLLAAGYAVQSVFRENRATRVDGQLASALATAGAAYQQNAGLALTAASVLAQSDEVQQGLSGDGVTQPEADAIADAMVPYTQQGLTLGVIDAEGRLLAGDELHDPAYRSVVEVQGPDGAAAGRIIAGFPLDAATSERLTEQAGDRDVTVGFSVSDQIVRPDGAQQGGVPATPGRGAVDANIVGTDYRFASLDLPDASPAAELLALYPSAKIDEANDDLRLRVALVVLIALAVILVLSEVVVRSITGQLGVYERRAKEVGEGKFAGEVPVHGNDEFAKFAVAFNTMSAELARRIDELENERQRVRRAVGRFGQALEATHDVSALLSIVVESAMEAVRARGGRLLIVDEQTGELVEQVRVGSARDGDEARLPARIAYGEGVEGLVLQTLRPALQREPEPMVSAPLQSTRSMIGLITLVDPELGQFRDEDGETLQALAAQGAIAIDNARMHRLITKQASTDGLTGLANRREFQDQLRREIERAQRFGLPLALILLDLDDFKLVNDRFGHLAGDSVLRAVASTVKSGIREIDCAARYGGEEFAIILPGATSEGAARLAERLRIAIAERPATAADGRPVRVTSSFGVAAMPEDATTQVELVAVADGALYAAKEAGKNRVVLGDGARRPGA